MQTLNVEFGSTAGSDGTLSVKVRVPRGQLDPNELDKLICNGMLVADIVVVPRSDDLFHEDGYEIRGAFSTEGHSHDKDASRFTMSCTRAAILRSNSMAGAYTAWGMFGALAGKAGTLTIERVGDIPKRSVGRPRKNADDGGDDGDEQQEDAA